MASSTTPWNLQDAKAKLSEIVDRARGGEPQFILRRGTPAAVVISTEEYERLRPRKSLISFLLHSPLAGSDINIPRSNEKAKARADLFNDET